MSQNRLTCLVPTHNRPHFMRRLLQFYSQFPLPCSFLVADSSHPSAAAENQQAIGGVLETLDINYHHFETDLLTKCDQALRQIRTPYVVFCADDDYLLPAAVDRCVDFLETNPGYSVAQGLMVVVNRPNRPPYASSGITIDDDRVVDRCRRIVNLGMQTYYGVYRTQTLCENFRITTQHLDCASSHFVPELLLRQLSVIQGRIKVFPEAYCLHECHKACLRFTPKVSDQHRGAELEWQFRECLSRQLEQTGISRSQAERHIEKWHGDVLRSASTGHKEFTIGRLQKFLRYTWRQVLNPFVKSGVLYRKRVQAADWCGQEEAWQEALRLMVTFPDGIPACAGEERLAA